MMPVSPPPPMAGPNQSPDNSVTRDVPKPLLKTAGVAPKAVPVPKTAAVSKMVEKRARLAAAHEALNAPVAPSPPAPVQVPVAAAPRTQSPPAAIHAR